MSITPSQLPPTLLSWHWHCPSNVETIYCRLYWSTFLTISHRSNELSGPTETMGPARVAAPKPGPAKLTPGAGLDEWLEEAKQCHYLPEPVMKELCEIVKEVLMEGRPV